jgi:sec-independent protein translocase protein TatA
MLGLNAPELIVIALVILILFGTKKMPEAARALGRSLRIFKAETRGLREDERADAAKSPDGPVPPAASEPDARER